MRRRNNKDRRQGWYSMFINGYQYIYTGVLTVEKVGGAYIDAGDFTNSGSVFTDFGEVGLK